jgi:protein-S-isoprenylcysteine O-methyltransferase Ste14
MLDFDKFWLRFDKKVRIGIDLVVFGLIGYLIFALGLKDRFEIWLFYVAMLGLIIETEVNNVPLNEKSYYFWTLDLLAILANTLWLFSLVEYFFNEIFVNNLVSVVGFSLVMVGVLLHYLSAKTLGKHYSASIEVKKSHKVVIEGVYKSMRHPGYVGSMLMAAGLPLILNSFWSLIVSLSIILVLVIRIHFEEKVLSDQVKGYKEYKRVVGILPKLRRRAEYRC